MLETGNGAHTRGAKYKMTRTKNALVEHYGALDIISTEDEEREGWDYIDIVYAGTDYGIQYCHTPRENYQKARNVRSVRNGLQSGTRRYENKREQIK